MKVELTGNAVSLVEAMTPGSFWFLRNYRVKGSSSGILEGRLYEKRGVRQLKVSDLSHEIHLKALLRYDFYFFAYPTTNPQTCHSRKRAWDNRLPDSSYAHKLLGYALEDDFFNCTVEVSSNELSAA